MKTKPAFSYVRFQVAGCVALGAAMAISAVAAPPPDSLSGQTTQTQVPPQPQQQTPAPQAEPAAPAKPPQEQTPPVAAPETPPAAAPAPPQAPVAKAEKPREPVDKAWGMLKDGVGDSKSDRRAKAVNSLGLLPGNAVAEKYATQALKDDKEDVRVAAAFALGSMHAMRARGALEKALDDPYPTVVLAAANSLMLLKDDAAYDVYYGVLTGTTKTNRGLVKEQMKVLHDRKKMAEMGIEEGIGFIPFAGIGYTVVKTVMKSDDSALVRAAAAKRLAHDPDPLSVDALVAATKDKSWVVRAAALEALAQRGDKSVLRQIAGAMDDDKDDVRFTAAACVAHLGGIGPKRRIAKVSKKPQGTSEPAH